MTIGERIKQARKAKGFTQKQLGELSKTSEGTVRQYEIGKRQPRLEQLQAIAAALDVPLEALVGIPDSVRAMGIDRVEVIPQGLLLSEFNEFERFIETLGYYTRLDGDNYRLHKGKASVVITPEQLKALVRASRATVAALVQDLMESVVLPTSEVAGEPPEGE